MAAAFAAGTLAGGVRLGLGIVWRGFGRGKIVVRDMLEDCQICRAARLQKTCRAARLQKTCRVARLILSVSFGMICTVFFRGTVPLNEDRGKQHGKIP